MPTESLSLISVILGGINLLALVTIAFQGGRWMGRVDVRLDHLERPQQQQGSQ